MHVMLIPGIFALLGFGGYVAADCAEVIDARICADEDVDAQVQVPVSAVAVEEKCVDLKVVGACVSAEDQVDASARIGVDREGLIGRPIVDQDCLHVVAKVCGDPLEISVPILDSDKDAPAIDILGIKLL